MKIIQRRLIYYIISGILIALSITALSIWGIQPGIDFKGGTMIEISFNTSVQASLVKESLKDVELPGLETTNTDNNSVIIRTGIISREQVDEIISTIKTNFTANPESGIKDVKEDQVQYVGPTIGKDVTKKAVKAVAFAVIAIVLYIAWSFRRVQRPFSSWAMSTATIIALIHDIIITLGFVGVMNHFFGFEANSYLLVALLTVLGFSVHDTIVVFDRIRENLLKSGRDESTEAVVNHSVVQTIARSLNTSLTAILVLLALSTIGSGTIKPFVLTLLGGMAVGTYSSIFIASPLLVTWDNIHKFRSSRHKKES